ncbi:MAG: hypothetical protein ACLS9K_12100, partial [Lachnospira eligens]
AEVLYPAMEDYKIDIMIGKGATARSIRLDLPQFTLIGATTRAGLLSAPLRDRFGVVSHMEFYTVTELEKIIIRSANVLNVDIDSDGAHELAEDQRNTETCQQTFKESARFCRLNITDISIRMLLIMHLIC